VETRPDDAMTGTDLWVHMLIEGSDLRRSPRKRIAEVESEAEKDRKVKRW